MRNISVKLCMGPCLSVKWKTTFHVFVIKTFHFFCIKFCHIYDLLHDVEIAFCYVMLLHRLETSTEIQVISGKLQAARCSFPSIAHISDIILSYFL